ncbi:MAG: hypothetical protein HYU64_17775 [Armatimonadetes bacterium]|nr:hypothetical protein [Armatimonadota bacterium]
MRLIRINLFVLLFTCLFAGTAFAQGDPKADQWFDTARLNVLIAIILLTGAFAYSLFTARKGAKMYIRPIAGLAAMDEAVGRATEMGKPVLFVAGIDDIDEIQTLAALSILSKVAEKTAEYETPLLMPCRASVVMTTAQEVVKESYLRAGRPDAYRSENIFYVSDEQFAFVAATDGLMMRERPAANFLLGSFFAESLILAETGHGTGAIQIAGTANAHQLPFFVAACDYTLIGEELYAASAYLSQDPLQVSTIKAQDIAKFLIMASIVIGCNVHCFSRVWFEAFRNLFVVH